MTVSIEDLLEKMVNAGSSDLHISSNTPPRYRVDGQLIPIPDTDVMTKEDTKKLIYDLLTEEQVARFEKDLELDFSFGVENLGRFRVNVFNQRGAVGMVARLIPTRIKTAEELNLPKKVIEDICNLPRGLVLVTGPTGSGKSTTLAAIIEKINTEQACHIVTIEDPIEFVFQNKKSLVNQREVGTDTKSFKEALRRILRQDPDVALIGELRDLETIEAALTLAETGHLTFGTLHTNDVAQTINRIVDVFPPYQQQQIRTQLSLTLCAVFCQALIPRSTGRGRVLALEVMVTTPAIKALIRDNKIPQVYSMIQTGGALGMKTMNYALRDLVFSGALTFEDAVNYSSDPEELRKLCSKGK